MENIWSRDFLTLGARSSRPKNNSAKIYVWKMYKYLSVLKISSWTTSWKHDGEQQNLYMKCLEIFVIILYLGFVAFFYY